MPAERFERDPDFAFQKNVAYFRRIENAPVCNAASAALRMGERTGARKNDGI